MTAKRYLLDASALLAAIHNEQGGETVQQMINDAAICSVNWSEVIQKLDRAGANTSNIINALQALGLEIVAFDQDDAQIAATLWPLTKPLGLSLADRACIAMGQRLSLIVVTADKAWKPLADQQSIQFIR